MFGENFPYTNFHDLNLDWIIKTEKENIQRVEQCETDIDAVEETVQNLQEYIDNLDEEIQDKINTEVPIAIQETIDEGGFNEILSESHARRVVFIADSYGQGWTPDGTFTSWCELVKDLLGLSSENYRIEAEGGAGFGKTSSEGRQYIPTLVQSAYQNISTPSTVTDIIIGLGYNDYYLSGEIETVSTGLQNTIASCKSLFPVARVHLFAIGFTTITSRQYALNVVYNKAYAKAYLDYSYHNISESLNHVSYMASDGIHPVQAGQNRIALNIIRCLSGSSPQYTYNTLAPSSVKFELLMGNAGQVTDMGIAVAPLENKVYATTQGNFKIVDIGNSGTITLPGNTVHKVAKLTQIGDYTGYFNPNMYNAMPAKMFVQKQGESGFTDFDIMLSIGTDANHADIFLYITVLGTNGGSFKSTGAFTRFGFQGLCLPLPFITNANEIT